MRCDLDFEAAELRGGVSDKKKLCKKNLGEYFCSLGERVQKRVIVDMQFT